MGATVDQGSTRQEESKINHTCSVATKKDDGKATDTQPWFKNLSKEELRDKQLGDPDLQSIIGEWKQVIPDLAERMSLLKTVQ